MANAALPDLASIHTAVAAHGTPLLLLRRSILLRQYRFIAEALPGVAIHYTLKALSHPAVVAALAAEGACFDICTPGEICLMRDAAVAPERCIHTHPIKRDADIRASLDYGCRLMVYDNAHEMIKFRPYRDQAELMLRLSFRSAQAVVDLSYKFGCAPDAALDLLCQTRDQGLRVRGLCFHVGSQNLSPFKYLEAIRFSRQLFNLAALEGIHLDLLDIGGGFPVPYADAVMPIDEFCQPIRAELERLFAGVRILAEPGRFVAAPAMTLVTAVIGKSVRSGTRWYYLDDGVYGSFSGKVFDHAVYPLVPLKLLQDPSLPKQPCVVAGPTCDSFDVLYEGLALPELEIGDLLVGPMMGAYTSASATTFNGLPLTPILAID